VPGSLPVLGLAGIGSSKKDQTADLRAKRRESRSTARQMMEETTKKIKSHRPERLRQTTRQTLRLLPNAGSMILSYAVDLVIA
jgi:hypothetical protein